MDFSYAPPPPSKGKRKQLPGAGQKKQKTEDFFDLPTHLPNTGSHVQKTVQSEDLLEEERHLGSGGSKEPIFIEGTSITLQTEEDIAKWIAERRKNWPTKKNIELKAKRELERKAPEPEKTPAKQVCKFYAKSKKCKFGAKCRNVHEAASNNSASKMINGILVAVPKRYKKEMQVSSSLYKNLMQRDHYEHENNLIIDFLQYLENNKLIDRHASL